MYYIEFDKLVVQNFMSIGNTPIEWNIKEKKKTLIVGKNYSGKTTLFQALTYGLFGRAYAKIKKSDLINDINQKNCRVEVTFNIGKKQYKIVRQIKPDSFEIYEDGELIPKPTKIDDYQDLLEKRILKMDFKSYTQLIMLGTAGYTPFLQLKALERRNFVENFLDIEVFTSMNKVFKKDAQENDNKIFEVRTKVDSRQNTINILTSVIENYERDNNLRLQTLEGEMKELYSNYKNSEKTLETINEQLSKIIVDDNIINETRANISKLSGFMQSKKSEAEKIRTTIRFFDTNPTCPSCLQLVGDEHKQKHLDDYNKQLSEISSMLIKSEKKTKELEEELNILYNNQTNKRNLLGQKSNTESKLDWYKSELKKKYSTKKELESFNGDTVVLDKKNQLQEETRVQDSDKLILAELITKKKYYDKILLSLKDSGAKAEIIKCYVPVICKHVNKYLEKLNLYLKFELDEEFNESLKARHRNEFQFESFSMGERMRINIALLWAWREVAKTKTGVETNLLCFDEVLEILDVDGFEELMGLVDDEPKLNCTIISHKTGIEMLFDRVLNVRKVKGFTQIGEPE